MSDVRVRLARAALAGQLGLSLTLARKAHGFALGCEAGYLFRDIVSRLSRREPANRTRDRSG